jgi:RNA polymerase sigma-70 factor (ECF subfamily)
LDDGAHGDVRSLVERAARGDPDAWERLYRRAHQRLFAYARRRLPADAAEDAVSETMLRAINRIDSFTWRGAGFDAWLYGILRHVVLEAYRRNGHERHALEAPVEHVPGPLDGIVERERGAQVRAAFDRLPADDQELLELRVVAGLSATAVGAVLGRRPGSVRMAQSRAVGRLRTAYRELEREH